MGGEGNKNKTKNKKETLKIPTIHLKDFPSRKNNYIVY